MGLGVGLGAALLAALAALAALLLRRRRSARKQRAALNARLSSALPVRGGVGASSIAEARGSLLRGSGSGVWGGAPQGGRGAQLSRGGGGGEGAGGSAPAPPPPLPPLVAPARFVSFNPMAQPGRWEGARAPPLRAPPQQQQPQMGQLGRLQPRLGRGAAMSPSARLRAARGAL